MLRVPRLTSPSHGSSRPRLPRPTRSNPLPEVGTAAFLLKTRIRGGGDAALNQGTTSLLVPSQTQLRRQAVLVSMKVSRPLSVNSDDSDAPLLRVALSPEALHAVLPRTSQMLSTTAGRSR